MVNDTEGTEEQSIDQVIIITSNDVIELPLPIDKIEKEIDSIRSTTLLDRYKFG